MTYSLTCTSCGEVVAAETEEEFVEKGRAHARKHGHTRPLSHQSIMARLHRKHSKEK